MLDSNQSHAQADQLFLIELPSLPTSVLDAWKPEITDVSLRKALFASPRLSDRILRDLLKDHGVSMDEPIESFNEVWAANALFSANLDALCLEMGCAWHANNLASTIAAGTHQEEISNLPREAVRKALTYRGFKSCATPPSDFSAFSFNQEGRKCIEAWTGTLPESIRARLYLVLGLGADAEIRNNQLRRAKLCRQFLEDFASDTTAT